MARQIGERLSASRLPRRTLIRGGILTGAGLAAATLAACGGDDKSSPSGAEATRPPQTQVAVATETPKPGGVYFNIDNVAATHRSPYHSGFEASQVRPMFQDYYDVLWAKRLTGPNPLVLELAESYEQVDPTHVVVKIRKGSVFHNRPPANGREVTAEDIAQDVVFMRDPNGRANYNTTFIRGDLTGPPQVIDPYTLRFETRGPRAYFFDSDQVAVSIVPKEMLNEQTLKESPPLGSGPWEFKDERQASSYEAKRFENYRVKGKPYPEGVKLTIVPDQAAMEAAFRTGQTHRLRFASVKDRDSVKKDLGSQIYVQEAAAYNVVGLVLNIFRDPWKDARVREAIWKAIDRERLINVVQFGDGFLDGYVPSDFKELGLQSDEIKPAMALDRARARQLLTAAGFPFDKEFVMPLPVEAQFYVDSGRLMAEDFAQLGIKTKLEPIPRTLFIQRVGTEPGEFDISMWPFQGANVRQQMRLLHTKEGAFQECFSLNDPEIDALVEKQEQELNTQEWQKLVQQIQRLQFQKWGNWIPTYDYNNYTGYYFFVKGMDFTPGAHNFQINRWLDK
jgi:peptide/nickel transport system substrate-binding protein